MNKTSKILMFVVLTLVLVGTGCVKNTTENKPRNQEKKTVVIGTVFPLTGDAASYGEDAKNGAELAIDKLNAKSKKYNYEIIYEDDALEEAKSVGAINKLINVNKVNYVIGWGSGGALAMCPIAEQNQIPLLVSGSSPEISKCGDYTFRNAPSDIYQGKILAEKMLAENYHDIAVLYINNDYGTGLYNEFAKNYAGNILVSEPHNPDTNDFRTSLTKIKNSNAKAVVLLTYLAEGSRILTQMQELGIILPKFACESLKDDNLMTKASVDSLNNLQVIWISQYDGKEYNEFKTAYNQKYSKDVGFYSDYIYDNILTLAGAIETCNDPENIECIKNMLYKTDLVGSTGPIEFDKNGDRVGKDYDWYKIEDEKFVIVK